MLLSLEIQWKDIFGFGSFLLYIFQNKVEDTDKKKVSNAPEEKDITGWLGWSEEKIFLCGLWVRERWEGDKEKNRSQWNKEVRENKWVNMRKGRMKGRQSQ